MAAFFDAYHPRVHDLAFRLQGERHAAEDLTQDTFLRLWQVAGRLDPHRDPWPWLVTITLNAHRDRLRRERRRPQPPSESEIPLARLTVSSAPGPGAEAMRRERDRVVQRALDLLSVDHRVVVVLRDYQGFDHEQIGRLIGVPPTTARKRYSRAIEALGKLLEEVEE